MHELSLALEVCRMAEERIPPEHRPRLLTVGVEVGDDAGIEVENFTFCLEALLAQPPFGRARPDVARFADDRLQLSYLEVDDDGPDD